MSPVSAGRYPLSAQSTLSHAPRNGGTFTCHRHLGNSILFTNRIHLDNLTNNCIMYYEHSRHLGIVVTVLIAG